VTTPNVSWLPMPDASTDDVLTFSKFGVLLNNLKFLQELNLVEHDSNGAHDVDKMAGKGAIAHQARTGTTGYSTFGFSGSTNPSTGVYRFTFTSTLSSANYAFCARTVQNLRAEVTARTTTYIEVSIYNTSDALVNLSAAQPVSVTVFQNV